jgi:hypothetical protein
MSEAMKRLEIIPELWFWVFPDALPTARRTVKGP